jgi:hypothetical protein
MRQFSDRILRRSLQVVKHAAALKALAQRFSPYDLLTLEANAKQKWSFLIRDHAEKLQQENSVLRREVAPVFPDVSAQSADESFDIESDTDLALAVQRLFQICAENDRAIRLAFSISPEATGASSLRTAQFWRSLYSVEVIAAKIARSQ